MSERRGRALALLSYVVVAVAVIGVPLFLKDVVAGQSVDLPGTLWIHWWVGQTLLDGDLPTWTNLLFYPDGKNFFNDTGANFLDAYLGLPLQWIFGVPDFLDVLEVLILVGNAYLFQRLAEELNEGHLAAAWGAALAFMVNPYTLQQVNEGRPTQALMWFALLALRHLVRLDRGSWKDGVLFGVFTLLQGLTYWFTVYFLVVAFLPVALWKIARAPKIVLARLAMAVGLCLAVAAPFLLQIGAEVAADRVPRLKFERWEQSPVGMPTRWRLIVSQFGQATWVAAFVGALLVLPRTWPWLLGGLLTLVFGVGPSLNITQPPLQNPVFIWVWEHVPYMPRLGFPERVASFGFLMFAVALARALPRLDTVVWAPMLALVAVGEARYRGAFPVHATGWDFGEAVDIVTREGGAVIPLPLGATEDAMVFQTRHGQPIFGGMGDREQELRPRGYDVRLDNTFVMMLAATLNDTNAPIGYTREDREAISREFRWVWLDIRGYPSKWNNLGYDSQGKVRRLVEELGPPAHGGEDALLWDLHNVVENPPGLGADAVMADADTRRVFDNFLVPAAAGPDTPPSR